MPICYEIDIEIERGEDYPLPGFAHIPFRFREDIPLTPESIRERVSDFFNEWVNRIGKYDATVRQRYRDIINWHVVGVYEC